MVGLQESPETLAKRELTLQNGSHIEYYVFPKAQTEFERVLVYIHGLVSDVNWFRVPENLPQGTGILFLPRHPRTHTERFEAWTEAYQECLKDFTKSHQSRRYHLFAQCFGTLPGLHWATLKPLNFATLTLANPPVVLRDDFDLGTKLRIFFGNKKDLQRSTLTPASYGRLPEMIRFIKNNPTTTFDFSNSFFLQTAKLQGWLRKNVFSFPCPTHCTFSSDDRIVKHEAIKPSGKMKEFPDRTTFFYSDHFEELLPNRQPFWDAVLKFQLENEVEYPTGANFRTVLVTGGTGFLASHIISALHQDGKEVIILARDSKRARKKYPELKERVEYREGTLEDLDSLDKTLDGVDAIVHTAGFVSEWDTYDKFEKVNVEGTKNLLVVAHEKGIKQFIHISSLGVFGDTDQDHVNENNPYVLSTDNYSNSKIHAEVFVQKYCRSNKIPFGIVRPGFIYGEGDNNFFPNLIRNLKGGKVKFIGSKENFVNTVYVGNVAALVATMAGNARSFGETYNISDPTDTTVSDLVWRVADHIRVPRPKKVIAKKIALALAVIFEATFRTFKITTAPPISRKKLTFVGRSRSVNASKAYALMGREPFSYEEGIKRTLAALSQ